MKLLLPNGCDCGLPTVHPKDWQTTKKITGDWYIHYYFRSPEMDKTKYPFGKPIRIKGGINEFKTPEERRVFIKKLLKMEVEMLKDGFNPIERKTKQQIIIHYEIDPAEPFLKALDLAYSKLKVGCLVDIRSVLKYTKIAAKDLGFTGIEIQNIKRKHIRAILEYLPSIKQKWSARTFNYYRSHLSIVFKELIRHEAIENNPLADIEPEKHYVAPRKTLTDEEVLMVHDFLKEYHYNFWRFWAIFSYSGARMVEMLGCNRVDLKQQKFWAVFKKGNKLEDKFHTITNDALPLWEELMENFKVGDYFFSENWEPGTKLLHRDRITDFWGKHVKAKFGKAEIREGKHGPYIYYDFPDFYAMKKLMTDRRAAKTSLEDAAKFNVALVSTTKKHYTSGEKEREHKKKLVSKPLINVK